MRIVKARAAVVAVAAAGLGVLVAASPASAQMAPTAAAFGISGVLASGGTAAVIPTIANQQANGFKAFNHTKTVPLFSEGLGIVSKGAVIGNLTVQTSGISTNLMSTGIASTSGQVQASSSVGSVQITMTLVSAGPSDPPLLSITANNVSEQVTNMRTAEATAQQTAAASFGSLWVSGTLLGGQTLSFSGAAPGNYVLYSDANMAITLNQQDVSGEISCASICQFIPKKISAEAIQIQFFHKLVQAKTMVSGNVQVAMAAAGLP